MYIDFTMWAGLGRVGGKRGGVSCGFEGGRAN